MNGTILYIIGLCVLSVGSGLKYEPTDGLITLGIGILIMGIIAYLNDASESTPKTQYVERKRNPGLE